MAIEELPVEIINSIGAIGLWLKAIGIVVIAWIIIQIVNLFLNRKKIMKLNSIQSDLERIEKKIDKIKKK